MDYSNEEIVEASQGEHLRDDRKSGPLIGARSIGSSEAVGGWLQRTAQFAPGWAFPALSSAAVTEHRDAANPSLWPGERQRGPAAGPAGPWARRRGRGLPRFSEGPRHARAGLLPQTPVRRSG